MDSSENDDLQIKAFQFKVYSIEWRFCVARLKKPFEKHSYLIPTLKQFIVW